MSASPDRSELIGLYARFRRYLEGIPEIFHHKEHYAPAEVLEFVAGFHATFRAIERAFEADAQLSEGEALKVGKSRFNNKETRTLRELREEFDTGVSLVYFNLDSDAPCRFTAYAKSRGMIHEAAVLERLFARFNAPEAKPVGLEISISACDEEMPPKEG